MDPETRHLIETLHRTPFKLVLALTGGGSRAAGLLLAVPGGSRTVLEAVVPYHQAAVSDFLGRHPEQFCSVDTSRALAARAQERGAWLAPGAPVLGVGCTASLVSDKPKRGEHRFHVAIQGDSSWTAVSLTLQKGARDREAEEALLDAVLLNTLAEAADVTEQIPLSLLTGEVLRKETATNCLLSTSLAKPCAAVCVQPDGQVGQAVPTPRAVLAGSFNPVHEGHWRLAEVAAGRLQVPVAFELSAANVDKAPPATAELRRRLQQFRWRSAVWVTRAPTFVEKAALFPGAVFVVGADTSARLVAPRYYEGRESQMLNALDSIRAHGCRFLVAGREDSQGVRLGLEELALPESTRDLFAAIPASEYHMPISSTALRQRALADAVAGRDREE
jgi:nicotinic acid mononucleotide adenylyltransferase